jgi:hypothetical protein
MNIWENIGILIIIGPLSSVIISLVYVFLKTGVEELLESRPTRIFIRGYPVLNVFYTGIYFATCYVMMTMLEKVIVFNGLYLIIYLISVLSNFLSLWKFTSSPLLKQITRLNDVERYIEDLKKRKNV